MPNNKPIVHLVCNAHIDPIWQWQWEEGALEALSTFRTAADFLEEYPDFIFNHNESLLYEWIEEFDPILFKRIQKLVKAGRWNISGGWYLQPDCNMPGGETFARLILTGRNYFQEKFGVRPKVAYNFDPFGHHGSMPQLLSQSGYKLYIHFRPGENLLKLPAILYRWQGLDGSEILAARPTVGYGHREGQIEDNINRGLELARQTNKDVLVMWGLGDHGGGATRADLEIIKKLQAEITDVEIHHSTPEAYLATLKPISEYPVHKGDLQRSFAGCYTSIAAIKRGMRRGEALLRSAEAWATMAWWTRSKEYPKKRLVRAWKDMLFNTFHDILPGSTLEAAVQDVMEKYGRSAHICRELRLASQLALLPNITPKPNTVPIYIFNPHASAISAPVSFEFLITHSPLGERKPYALYDDKGTKIASQDTNGPYEQSQVAINWQRNLNFIAEVPPMSVRRYEVRIGEQPAQSKSQLTVKQTKTAITVENKWVIAKFLHSTGGLASLIDKATGRDLLKGSVRPVAMDDNLDAWGGEDNVNFSTPLGDFTPLSTEEVGNWVGDSASEGPALNVLFQGSVSVTVQSLVGWRRSRVMQHFTLYADSPFIDVFLRAHWQERSQCLKWVLPFRLQNVKAVCEVPFAAIERPTDGTENVGGRWVRVEEKGGDELAVGVANNGQYGFHVRENGELGLSLARGAMNCRFGDVYTWNAQVPVNTGEYHTHMDQGQHDFRFRLVYGKAAAVAKALVPAAMELNMPLEPIFVYNHPTPQPDTPTKTESFVEITPNTIVLSALKKAEKSDDLILRINETLGKKTTATIKLLGANPVSVNLHPFEIKTFRARKTRRGVELEVTGLLEERI